MLIVVVLFSWVYSLSCLLLRFVARQPIMSSLVRRISQRVDFLMDTRAPLAANGRPQGDTVEKGVDNLIQLKVAVTSANVPALLDALKNRNGVGIDDRKLLLESLIEFMSTLKNNELSMRMQKVLLDILYKDLPHPPNNFLAIYPLDATLQVVRQGPIKYAYRTVDGSFNNPLVPALGKAGTPYARSVPTTNIAPKAALPDPGLVFDTLLKRDEFEKHSGGISSLFFAFANLVIHSIFNTNHRDWTINDSSSYLDLSILYGSCEEQQALVRRGDGSGKLHEDVFADKRLLLMPPATCALLVLLCRNHNFIAQRLLDINENGNFVVVSALKDEGQKNLQDDELFHRSRLVNCGYFMKIILGDYVGAILGLVRDESDWRLDPLMTMRSLDHEFSPTGQGNAVSIEFNLLYRWHATLSEPDSDWLTQSFSRAFPGKDVGKLTPKEFEDGARKGMSNSSPPTTWEFGGMTRDRASNRFKDEDLAKILYEATEARAGAFKARGIPEYLRVVEIMGIMQSRSWGACSLNEFRKFLGLKPYDSFEEWNSNKEIHAAAAKLYRDIDNLELYVGLQAEEPKKPSPGAGLCPGYTISRAILADAVALTRGDRYMTTEFSPYNLTKWGYHDCQYDTKDGSYGGMLTKLLFRHLPQYYPERSAYAHFPFLDPTYMEPYTINRNPGLAAKYTWTRPRPKFPIYAIDDFGSVKRVLSDPSRYRAPYEDNKFAVVEPSLGKQDLSIKQTLKKRRLSLFASNGHNSTIKDGEKAKGAAQDAHKSLKDEEKNAEAAQAFKDKTVSRIAEISKAVFHKPTPKIATYFADKTRSLIQEKSLAAVNSDVRHVDIVKDVINLVPLHWISHMLGLPLKSQGFVHGAWQEESTYAEIANVARYVYLNFDPVDDWKLREAAQATAAKFIDVIEAHLNMVNPKALFNDLFNHVGIDDYHGHDYLKRLWRTCGGKEKDSYRNFAAQVFASVVPTAALYSHCVAHIVNVYLEEDNKAVREEIVQLINSGDKGASSKILGYVHQAWMQDSPFPGVFRTVLKHDILDSGEMKTGSRIFVSVADASQEEFSSKSEATVFDFLQAAFTESGTTGFLTSEFFEHTILPMLGVILSLKGLERGPGRSGQFNAFKKDIYGTRATQYIDLQSAITPLADSLIIRYEQPSQ